MRLVKNITGCESRFKIITRTGGQITTFPQKEIQYIFTGSAVICFFSPPGFQRRTNHPLTNMICCLWSLSLMNPLPLQTSLSVCCLEGENNFTIESGHNYKQEPDLWSFPLNRSIPTKNGIIKSGWVSQHPVLFQWLVVLSYWPLKWFQLWMPAAETSGLPVDLS